VFLYQPKADNEALVDQNSDRFSQIFIAKNIAPPSFCHQSTDFAEKVQVKAVEEIEMPHPHSENLGSDADVDHIPFLEPGPAKIFTAGH
jgi:hypothetical protein